MATELATGYIRLMPSARGFRSAIDREIGTDLVKSGTDLGDRTGRNFGRGFSGRARSIGREGALVFAAAFTGAAILGKQAIDAASALEESQNKVNVVFGEGADEIRAFARAAAESVGLSEQGALDAAGSFGNMFVQLGIGTDVAADMSTEMVTLASDFASFHNADISEVIAAQEAAFRGEYDAVQRFVPTINAAAVEQRALEMGLADANGELDAQDRALATQTLLLEGAGDAAGDFERTSGGLANQQRITAARMKDLQASLGKLLIPAMAFGLKVVLKLVDGFKAMGKWLADNKPIMIGALVGIGVALATFAALSLSSAAAATAAWIAAALPFIAIGLAVAAVVAGFVWAYQNIQVFRNVVDTVVDAVGAAAGWLADQWTQHSHLIGDAISAIGSTVSSVFNGIKDVISAVMPTIQSIISTGVDLAVAAWDGIQVIYTWFRDNVATKIASWFRFIRETAKTVLETAVTWAIAAWGGIEEIYTWFRDNVATKITAWFRVIRETAKTVLETAVKWAVAAWNGMSTLYTWFRDNVALKITAWLRMLRDSAKTTLETAVKWAVAAWAGMQALYTWVRDNVILKITPWFRMLRDSVKSTLETAVKWGTTAWNGIVAIYTFFRDNVFNPVKLAVTALKDYVINAFDLAVDGVKAAWDLLKNVVKTPINVVIGFYNNGIRAVWNAVISKIPGVGDLGEIATLNRGGWVPGSGDRDTVPALLTPGEFVITKDAAKTLGPQVLNALNSGGTLDPGIFGYREGGYARSADEALEWARQQNGKPYRFPDVGPDSYDCSGFTSALINYILGRNPYQRRHSSGSMGSDSALARGAGDNPMGALFGARPPYMRNNWGAFVGHTTATLAGVNMEATPPRVRVGGNARGAESLPRLFHLPGFGGLTDDDRGIVAMVKSLLTMKLEGLLPPLGDLLQKMINTLPGRIYDFFMDKLPSIIIDAIKGIAGSIVGGTAGIGARLQGAANGGIVGRPGPILVGERGPEMVWGSRGMFIQSNADLAAGRRGADGSVTVNNYHRPLTVADISRGIRMARAS